MNENQNPLELLHDYAPSEINILEKKGFHDAPSVLMKQAGFFSPCGVLPIDSKHEQARLFRIQSGNPTYNDVASALRLDQMGR